jgi:hypothetical protein
MSQCGHRGHEKVHRGAGIQGSLRMEHRTLHADSSAQEHNITHRWTMGSSSSKNMAHHTGMFMACAERAEVSLSAWYGKCGHVQFG